MVTKLLVKESKTNVEPKINNRLSYCSVCGEPVFKIRVELEGLGWRSWWHEREELDIEHVAEPDGRVRDA